MTRLGGVAQVTNQIKTQFMEFGSAEDPYKLAFGKDLPGIRVAYETWGELNEDGSNAILLCHALSGSHHAWGYNPEIEGVGDLWQEEMHQGWWEDFMGPGKSIDTNKFFVVCANYLGGCYGTTGPRSINPLTGKAYGSTFPHLTVADQADMMAKVIQNLGISKLHAVIGPSVGGLIALTFAARHAEKVHNVISVASGFKTTVLNRLILFEQILAIENDRNFNAGDYYDGASPDYGLALARMISHKTFVHLDAIERRARQDVRQDTDTLAWYEVRDPFQSYMLHQGKKFVKRFDANTYLRIIDMWSRYDAVETSRAESVEDLLKPCREAGHRFLVFSIDSDFCFYPEEQANLVQHLEQQGVDCMHITVHSDKGHDSFLLEPYLYAPHISYVLNQQA